jgi:hypothetical protein
MRIVTKASLFLLVSLFLTFVVRGDEVTISDVKENAAKEGEAMKGSGSETIHTASDTVKETVEAATEKAEVVKDADAEKVADAMKSAGEAAQAAAAKVKADESAASQAAEKVKEAAEAVAAQAKIDSVAQKIEETASETTSNIQGKISSLVEKAKSVSQQDMKKIAAATLGVWGAATGVRWAMHRGD